MPEVPENPAAPLEVIALPAFQDNYIWLLAGPGGDCIVVDPGDAAPVLEAASRGLRPVAVLLTHHHADHVGGVGAVLEAFPVPCHGPDDPRIPAAAQRVADGDRVQVPALGASFDVIAVPGHTRSHIAFHGGGRVDVHAEKSGSDPDFQAASFVSEFVVVAFHFAQQLADLYITILSNCFVGRSFGKLA